MASLIFLRLKIIDRVHSFTIINNFVIIYINITERRSKVFRRLLKNGSKRSAVVFVDFEHWYYGYNNIFSMKPNIDDWINELNAQ